MPEVFVECYADEMFLEFAIRQADVKEIEVIHAKSKSKVIIEVTRTSRSIGLIDEDPKGSVPTEMEEMMEKFDDSYMNIRMYEHKNGSKLIELKPRLEERVIRLCNISNIDPRKYGLPRDPELLHKIINQKIKNFKKLLDELFKNSKIFKKAVNIIKNTIEETKKEIYSKSIQYRRLQ